jgi:hypothetical protein
MDFQKQILESLPLDSECNTWKYSTEGFNVIQQRS